MKKIILTLLIGLLSITSVDAKPIAFLTHPRTTGRFPTQSVSEHDGPHLGYFGWDENVNPPIAIRNRIENTKLVIREDNGVERVLVANGAFDFKVSLDAKSIFATIVNISTKTANIYKIDIATGDRIQLTNHSSWNTQPVECGDGSIVFSSDRDGWRNPGEQYKAFTLYRMRADGREVQRIWHAGLGGVFAPFCGPDGRIYFTSGENQGGNMAAGTDWGVWSINPDGSNFRPEISANFFSDSKAADAAAPFDFPVITSDGSLIASHYYDTRIYGELIRVPGTPNTSNGTISKFGPPLYTQNPPFNARGTSSGFQRPGMKSITPVFDDNDNENSDVTHAYPIPGNGILYTYVGPDPHSQMNLDICILADSTQPLTSVASIVKLVADPNRHEWMGQMVASHMEIYGIEKPEYHEKKVATSLHPASTMGIVGTTDTAFWNEVLFNQQAKMRKPTSVEEPEYIRIVVFQPSFFRPKNGGTGTFYTEENRYPFGGLYGGSTFEGFKTPFNEREGFYTQLIPLKKYRTPTGGLHLGPNPPAGSTRIMRPDNPAIPDSSFKAEMFADTPWSLHLLNAKKEAIFVAATWHQVIPVEARTDCQGCHAHNKPDPLLFTDLTAGKSEYPRIILDTVKTLVYERDIKPVLPNVPATPWRNRYNNIWPLGSESWTQQFDDNVGLDAATGVKHHDWGQDTWTDAQKELFRAWQDTGFLAGGYYWKTDWSTFDPNRPILAPLGAYEDTTNPILNSVLTNEDSFVGITDVFSGIKTFKVVALASGADVTSSFVKMSETDPITKHIYRGPAMPGGIKVTVTDNRNNITEEENLTVINSPEPTPTPEATFVDFQDVQGDLRSRTPDGKVDYHFTLTNLQNRPIDHIDVKAGSGATDFKWSNIAGNESPTNPEGTWWLITYSPTPLSTPSTTRDIWFANPKPDAPYTDFRIYVHYAAGDTLDRDFMTSTSPVPPPPEVPDECEEVRQQLTEAQATIVELTNQLTASQSQVTQLQSQIVSLQGQLTTSQGQIAQLQGQVTQLQGQLQQSQAEVTSLTTELNQAIVERDNAIAELQRFKTDIINFINQWQ